MLVLAATLLGVPSVLYGHTPEPSVATKELVQSLFGPSANANPLDMQVLDKIKGEPMWPLDPRLAKTRALEAEVRRLANQLPGDEKVVFEPYEMPYGKRPTPMMIFPYLTRSIRDAYLIFLGQRLTGVYSPSILHYDASRGRLRLLYNSRRDNFYGYTMQARDLTGDGEPEFLFVGHPSMGTSQALEFLEIFKLVSGKLKTIFFAVLREEADLRPEVRQIWTERPTFVYPTRPGPPKIILDIDYFLEIHRLEGVLRLEYAWQASGRGVFEWDAGRQSFQPSEDGRAPLIDLSAKKPVYRYDGRWRLIQKNQAIGGGWDAAPRR